MKRLEGEDFKAYRLRRTKDNLMQELSLGGKFLGTKTYARTLYLRRKYKQLKDSEI